MVIGTSAPPVAKTADHKVVIEEISSWLTRPAEEVDSMLAAERGRVIATVDAVNAAAAVGDESAVYLQQLVLSRIYQTIMQVSDVATAEGSVLVHEITRKLELATIEAQDRMIESGLVESAPAEPGRYLSWLKGAVRAHRAFKHPYYTEFINLEADDGDLRTYAIQESVVDGRFDDFLAMMQVGTSGAAKMEIANNFWDEMGNGDPDSVHTHLFNKIYDVFDIRPDELESTMTAHDLLSGNLAVLVCRYRSMYPEAVGFLGVTEWLVPDRFVNVLNAWSRLGLPEVGVTYHKLHVTIDSQHAAGWFHNVVLPAATSEYMRWGIARGALWRANSSASHLDERLAHARVSVAG